MDTAPDRRQRVQTFIRRRVRPTWTRILWMFGYQTRDETLWAWLIRFPCTGRLPQMSHDRATRLSRRLDAKTGAAPAAAGNEETELYHS